MSSKKFSELLSEAQEIVRSKVTWRKFIKSTPLDNDIAVWMVEFARADAAQPELAELQATIAQQAQQIAALKLNLEMSVESSVSLAETADETIARLTANIERLKGGQGEPVAWMWRHATGNSAPWFYPYPPSVGYSDNGTYIVTPLAPVSESIMVGPKIMALKEEPSVFSSVNCLGGQPPSNYGRRHASRVSKAQKTRISIVFPIRQPEQNCDYTEGWNACIDKVKELNK